MTRSPRPESFRCCTPSAYIGITWPDCVPGRRSSPRGPSRVSTVRVAPSAAATIGIVTVQCRSSPCRSNIACGRCRISRNRSPGGPPPGPTSPSPASWMCVPSSTPAGMRTLIVRRVRTRPAAIAFGAGPAGARADPAAGRAWPRGHHLAQERPRDLVHLAASAAHVAGLRVGARRGALPGAGRADHRGVHDQLPGGPERALGEVQLDPDGGVAPAARAAARAPGSGAGAEKLVHDVGDREPGTEAGTTRRAGSRRERVRAQVVHLPLLRVGEHLVGLVDLLEALLRRRIGVHIRMQLAGEPPVRLLDLIGLSLAADAENAVIIVGHQDPARIWPTYRATARTAPRSEERRVGKECRSRWSPYH